MRKLFIALAMFAVLLSGCTDKKEKMVEFVKEDLAKTYKEQSLKVLGVSQPDSAFGFMYYTDAEVKGIANIMTKVSGVILKRTNDMQTFNPEDLYVMDLAERQMTALSGALRPISQGRSDKKGDFSGWKVKVDYQYKNKEGLECRAEKWYFLDKEGEKIEQSFELPLP